MSNSEDFYKQFYTEDQDADNPAAINIQSDGNPFGNSAYPMQAIKEEEDDTHGKNSTIASFWDSNRQRCMF